MKNKKIIAVILVIVLIALVVLGAYLLMKNKTESTNLESYKGYWYAKEESTELAEYDELNIKEIKKETITFDYTLAMLCSDKDIKVEIKDGKGDFKTEESQGTIKLENDKVELKVKNTHYDDTEFEKIFSLKSSESRNEKLLNDRKSQDNIVGEWKIKQIIDVERGEDRGNSQHFGIEIAEKYHFEFYNDGTYIMLLGERDEEGTYEVVDNKVNMTSKSNELRTLEITKDEDGNKVLVENEKSEGKTVIKIYYDKL